MAQGVFAVRLRTPIKARRSFCDARWVPGVKALRSQPQLLLSRPLRRPLRGAYTLGAARGCPSPDTSPPLELRSSCPTVFLSASHFPSSACAVALPA